MCCRGTKRREHIYVGPKWITIFLIGKEKKESTLIFKARAKIVFVFSWSVWNQIIEKKVKLCMSQCRLCEQKRSQFRINSYLNASSHTALQLLHLHGSNWWCLLLAWHQQPPTSTNSSVWSPGLGTLLLRWLVCLMGCYYFTGKQAAYCVAGRVCAFAVHQSFICNERYGL